MKTTNSKRLQRGMWGLCAALVAAVLCGASARADSENAIQVSVGEAITLSVENVAKIAVAEPTIADIVSLSEREISVIGKKVGTTTLTIVRLEGKPTQIYRVEVGNDAVAAVIHKMVAAPNIVVRVVGDSLVLDGKVDDELDAQRALQVAGAFYKDRVVNLLEIQKPRQIKIRTRVVEVRTDAVKHLGLRWFGPGGQLRYSVDYAGPGLIGGKPFGQSYISGLTQPQANGGSASGIGNTIDTGADVVLQLLESKGYARLLSEPTLITYNGKEASFLVGQQIPITQQLPNSFTVEYKDVGVRMKIKPTADSQNAINTSIHAEVSKVVGVSGLFAAPIIGIKESDTTLQVKDGQTIVIAGLIDHNIDRDALRKLPWLANIPILGVLFRSKEFESGESEVLFFVTPSVIKDIDAEVANAVRTPVMKEWNEKEAGQGILGLPDKKDDWGMHNFGRMGLPEGKPSAPKPAESEPPAKEPTTNFSPARPTGE